MFFDGIGIGFEKNLVSEKVLVSVLKIFGIEKSISFDFLASIKVLDSVSLKFWVSSHAG